MIQHQIEILMAFRDGAIIESRQINHSNIEDSWKNITGTSAGRGRFNFAQYEYRIGKARVYKIRTSMGYSLLSEHPLATDEIVKIYEEIT